MLEIEICDDKSVTFLAFTSVTVPSSPEIVNRVESSLGKVSIRRLNNSNID